MAHILVVDEDQTTRMVIRTLLEDAGHEVVEAANGSEGLRALVDRVPDLIITELYMDGMDGIELLRRVRKAWLSEPVLVMSSRSGLDAARVLQVAQVLGASGLLDKPIVERHLLDAVGAILAA
jgi:CheY-like chemotaxis protein